MTSVTGTPGTETTHLVEQDAREMLPGRFETFGYVLEDGNWIKTQTTKSRRQIAVALEFFVRNVLMLYNLLAVRIGRSLPRFPATPPGSHSLLVWWNGDLEHCNTFQPDTTEAFSSRWLVGDDWRSYKYIQAIMDEDNDHKFQDILAEDGEDMHTQADASGRTDLSDPETTQRHSRDGRGGVRRARGQRGDAQLQHVERTSLPAAAGERQRALHAANVHNGDCQPCAAPGHRRGVTALLCDCLRSVVA